MRDYLLELHPLAVEFDLIVFASDEGEGSIIDVEAYKIAGLVETILIW